MSYVSRMVMQTIALEAERFRDAVEDASGLLMPYWSNEELQLRGTPSSAAEVDATNLMVDPFGRGGSWGSYWAATNGTLSQVQVTDLTYHQYAVRADVTATPGALSVRAIFDLAEAGDYWWYAFAKSNGASCTCRLRRVAGNVTIGSSTTLTGSIEGWVMIGGDAAITTTGSHEIELTKGTTAAGQWVQMTAPTICLGTDPGGPFTGDSPVSSNYAYSWSGPRWNSTSRRHRGALDVMALMEREHGLSIKPSGTTLAQRQAYLRSRHQARRQPWGSTFKDLIVKLIQADDPTFTASGVRVAEDWSDYSFQVEIAYAPTGVLVDRVKQLIVDTKPAHLKFDPETDITWGSFIVGVNEAGDPL
jgi:hypothetical protein